MTTELMTAAPVQLDFNYNLIPQDKRSALRQRSLALRSLVGQSAKLAIAIGVELDEIWRDYFKQSNEESFSDWLLFSTGFSREVAAKYIRLAHTSHQFTEALIDHATIGALHVLSAESTPVDVIQDANKLAESGAVIKSADARGLIKSAAHRAKGEPLFIPEQQIEVRGEGAYQNQVVTVEKIDGDVVYARTDEGKTVPFLAGEFSDSVPLPKEPGKRGNSRGEIEALEFEIEVLKAENQELRSIITRARSSMPDGLLKEIAEMGL